MSIFGDFSFKQEVYDELQLLMKLSGAGQDKEKLLAEVLEVVAYMLQEK